MADRADGSVVIRVVAEADEAEKQLNKLKKKIGETERQIEAMGDRIPLDENLKDLGVRLDEASRKLHEMRAAAKGTFSADQIAEQAQTVKTLQVRFNEADRAITSYDKKLAAATQKLNQQKTEAGELAQKINAVSAGTRAMAAAQEGAAKSAQRFGMRIREVVRSALVFTLITQTLAKFREWMGAVIKPNAEASASVSRLKGALLTLAQPLVDILLPAFVTLVNLLTAVVGKLAEFTAMLGGTTVADASKAAEALKEEADALEETGGAAKKASKTLASFDEINKLSDSGAGENKQESMAPDFSWSTGISEQMSKIASAVLIIGAGLALWKISSMLPGQLGTIGTAVAGLVIAVGGLKLLWEGLNDAWENGIDWGNFTTMLAGAAALVLGLGLAFGSLGRSIGLLVAGVALLVVGFKDISEHGVTWENLATILAGVVGVALGLFGVFGKVGGAIGLLVGGIALLVAGFKDVFNNGFTLQNTLMVIAGLFATGLGIALLTGSLIPALIAGIGGILLAITVLTGNGGQLINNLKQIMEGLSQFITGIMTGDIEGAFEGLKNAGKGAVNAILTVFGSMVNIVIRGLNWLIEKINTIKFTVPEWVPLIGGNSVGFNLKKVKEWDIPQLAQGAVIPPNREFLAVLGDQKNGTNIETPLATMVQAFKQAMAESGGGGGDTTIILELDGQQFGKATYKAYNRESRRVGVNLAGVK